jgi:type I restriction enzyme R subunit
VILTTSQLLTTGVDAQTCKNIVIAKVINSMTEFKQVIGRGTRVRDDYGKLFFSILDYTGSATRLFADPDFDGDPAICTEENMDDQGAVTDTPVVVEPEETLEDDSTPVETTITDEEEPERRKYYYDEGQVEIVAHLVYELDPDGRQLRVVKYTEYAGEKIRTLYPTAAMLRKKWADPQQRSEIIALLEERGIDTDELRDVAKQPDADPFDLLCHIAFNAPLRTRRERADRLRKDKKDFFDQYSPEACAILKELLEKYAEHGTAQFVIPDVLKIPPISEHGNVMEIAEIFGGADNLKEAVHQLQTLLYAA